jgi:hypothetical protein
MHPVIQTLAFALAGAAFGLLAMRLFAAALGALAG